MYLNYSQNRKLDKEEKQYVSDLQQANSLVHDIRRFAQHKFKKTILQRDLHNLKQTETKKVTGGRPENELLREWVDGFVETSGNTVNSLTDEDGT